YCWLGNVGFTRAQIPTLFENDGIFYAAGYAGSGTVWARWLGKKIAETAMGTGNQPSAFWGRPPPRIPFYDGNPWFKDWIKRR
ncbi:MAG: oxidoreductase, partial [Paracoccaceae bacterium]